MRTMTLTEITAFLQSPQHAILGVNRRDGPPHLSPVWYLYEAPRFYIAITTTTLKYRLLQRDPCTSLCVDGGHRDYRSVMATGMANFYLGDDLEALRWRIIRRYYDDEAVARRFFESTREESHVLLIINPDRIIGLDHS